MVENPEDLGHRMVFFHVIPAVHGNTLSLMSPQHVSLATQYAILTDDILPSSSWSYAIINHSLFEVW